MHLYDAMSPLSQVTRVDVRGFDQSARRSMAVLAYRRLPVGESMELVDGHNPVDLYSALHGLAPGDFSWLYLTRGPAVWTVAVQKLGRLYSAGECCGVCGGGTPQATNPTRSNHEVHH